MVAEIRYIDLFAGCGGLSLGLHQAGLSGIFAIEKNPDAFNTLKYNLVEKTKHFLWPSWLPIQNWDIKDLINIKKDEIKLLNGSVDLVVGGPPCQGFSMAGKRQETDARNDLIHSYLDFVELVNPDFIVFENVLGFTVKFPSKNEKVEKVAYSKIVIDRLIKLGYKDAQGRLINVSEYGVPQNRKRFIVIATKTGVSSEIFSELDKNRENFFAVKKIKNHNTTKDALSDLVYENGTTISTDTNRFEAGITSSPRSQLQLLLRKSEDHYVPDSHRYVNHTEKIRNAFVKLLETAPRNKCISGKELVFYGIKKRNVTILDSNCPSPTITTIPDDYIHYSEPRIMTVRECARLQTFPDWFEFKGPYTTGGKERTRSTPRYTQVGNAVPPLFAEQIGLAIIHVCNGEIKE